MLIMMVFDFVVSMTDVVIAGQIDKSVQASIGLTNSIYMFFTVIVQAITSGTVAVVSRTFGSPDNAKKLPSAIYTAATLACTAALLFSLISFIFAPVVISMMDADPIVKARSVVLMRIYSVGMFFHLAIINLNGVLRACRLMVSSMKIMVFAALLNVVLTIVMVFFTPLGFMGIALSTAMSWIIASVFVVKTVLKLTGGVPYSYSREVAARIAKIGWPSGIVIFCWQASGVVVFWIMGQMPESVEVMAAFTVGLRIESMIFMPAFALHAANAVIVGNLLGQGKPEEAFQAGMVTVMMGVCLIIGLTVIVISAASPIANLLAAKDENGLADPQVVGQIIGYLRIVMLSEPFVACNAIVSGALMGAGDTRSMMFYTIFSIWIVRIPVIYIGAVTLGLGVNAIWWGMNFTFLSQSSLVLRRFVSRKWAN